MHCLKNKEGIYDHIEIYMNKKDPEPWVALKEGEYFVMGDNRNNSTDSRSPSIGVVRKEEMVGRAFMRIWPITDIKILKH